MENNEIRIGEALETGFGLFKEQLGFWLTVMGVFFIISIAPVFFNEMQTPGLQGLIAAILMVLSTVVGMGMLRIGLNSVDKRESSLGDLFSLIYLFIRYLLMSVAAGIITLTGLVLLVVPGVILAIRLGFADMYVVDTECGPVNALQFSWELTRGHAKSLFLFWLALIGINIAGFLALGLGLFVSIPVTYIARAYVFRKLQKLYQEKAGQSAGEAAP